MNCGEWNEVDVFVLSDSLAQYSKRSSLQSSYTAIITHGYRFRHNRGVVLHKVWDEMCSNCREKRLPALFTS